MIVIFLLLYGPMLFGYTGYSIVSKSMEPNYSMGSIVYGKRHPFEKLKEGDVICFYPMENDKSVVTHSISQIDYQNKKVVTKGLANNYEDINPVSEKQIIGRVEEKLPYLGYINLFLQTKAGTIVIIFIPVLLLFLILLANILSSEKEKSSCNRYK